MQFAYYEILPYAKTPDGQELIASSWDEFSAWQELNPGKAPDFWTLFGRYHDKDAGGYLACAIGDFATFKDAEAVQDAILAPMIAARSLLSGGNTLHNDHCYKAYCHLEDCILQSSTGERL